MLAPDANQSCYVSRLTVPQATAGQAGYTALLLRKVSLEVSLLLVIRAVPLPLCLESPSDSGGLPQKGG